MLSLSQIFLAVLFKSAAWAQEQGNHHGVSSHSFRTCTYVHNCPARGEGVPQWKHRGWDWYFINLPTTSKISVSLTLTRHTRIVRSGYQPLPEQSEGFLQWSGACNLPLYPSASEFLISMAEIQHLGWTAVSLPGKMHWVQPTFYLIQNLSYLFICFCLEILFVVLVVP